MLLQQGLPAVQSKMQGSRASLAEPKQVNVGGFPTIPALETG